MKHNNTILTNTIQTKDPNIWREFRNKRNITSKNIEKCKANFIQKKFSNCADKWKILRNYNDKPSQQIPSNITFNLKY